MTWKERSCHGELKIQIPFFFFVMKTRKNEKNKQHHFLTLQNLREKQTNLFLHISFEAQYEEKKNECFWADIFVQRKEGSQFVVIISIKFLKSPTSKSPKSIKKWGLSFQFSRFILCFFPKIYRVLFLVLLRGSSHTEDAQHFLKEQF